jgi:putative nucleotidyltransferase with HDIG domain
MKQIEIGAGTRFDPQVVRVFNELEPLGRIRRSIESGAAFALPPAGSTEPDVNQLTFEQAVREIETEPLLAVCVLREANAEGGARPTARLDTSCARLGEARLREICARVGAPFRLSNNNQRLWEHSLRTAEAARLLAGETMIIDADDAYTMGLLHDMGEALLRSLFPAEMGQLDISAEGERSEKEMMLFGVDHAQVGQWVLETCGLPRAMTTAVQTHHDVTRINSPVALLLHVADAVAEASDPYAIAALDSIDTERLYMLGLNRGDLFRVQVHLDSAVVERLDPVYC